MFVLRRTCRLKTEPFEVPNLECKVKNKCDPKVRHKREGIGGTHISAIIDLSF